MTLTEGDNMNLSVFGTGNMGQAMIRGLLGKQAVRAQDLRLYDKDAQKAAALADETGAVACAVPDQALAGSDTILLAVKPADVPAVLQAIRPYLDNQLLISIAAGITIGTLRRLAGPDVAIARVMPNTPALIGAGVSAVCFDQASAEQQQKATLLLAACGRVYPVPESAMDAVTGLSGSGPAYIMLVIESLADGAVRQGLPRELALEMAAMTVYGSAGLVLETGKHPAVIKDQVCSPGGTTIEAVASLEADGLRSAFIRAVAAATEQSRRLREPAREHE
jgi:pyrroline-5-carboxylate reductase